MDFEDAAEERAPSIAREALNGRAKARPLRLGQFAIGSYRRRSVPRCDVESQFPYTWTKPLEPSNRLDIGPWRLSSEGHGR